MSALVPVRVNQVCLQNTKHHKVGGKSVYPESHLNFWKLRVDHHKHYLNIYLIIFPFFSFSCRINQKNKRAEISSK